MAEETPPPSPPAPPPSPPAPPPAPPAPPPPPAAPAGKFYDGAEIDDDTRAHFEASGYKSWADVAKSERHAQTLLGADKATVLRLPKDRSDPAQWAEVNKALGIPADATIEAYGLKPDDALGLDKATLDGFLAKVHGRPPGEFVKSAIEWYIENQTAAAKATETALAQQGEAVQRELDTMFGAAKDERLAAIGAVLQDKGSPELSALLDESGLGNNIHLVKLLDWVAQEVAEKTALPGDKRAGSGALTPAEAEARLRDFERANADGLHSRTHPDHKSLVAERNRLIGLANPAPRPT